MSERRVGLLLLLAVLLVGCQAAQPAAPARPASGAAPAAASSTSAGAARQPTAAQEAPAPSVIRVAHAGVAPEVAAVWLATDLGLDRQHGLQIELIQTRSAALSQAALLSGEIDYAWTGLGPTLGARSGGSSVMFLGATSTRAASELMVQPGITTPEGLRGAALG